MEVLQHGAESLLTTTFALVKYTAIYAGRVIITNCNAYGVLRCVFGVLIRIPQARLDSSLRQCIAANFGVKDIKKWFLLQPSIASGYKRLLGVFIDGHKKIAN